MCMAKIKHDPCPDPELLAAYIDPSSPLDVEEKARILDHLAGCVTCLQLIAGAIKTRRELFGDPSA